MERVILRKGLKKGREIKRVTQKDVASYLGIAVNNYQNIEAGRNGTSENNWLKLFEYFNKEIPLHELMKDTKVKRNSKNKATEI